MVVWAQENKTSRGKTSEKQYASINKANGKSHDDATIS